MALKAGRVGVAPDQVDEFGIINSEATSGYTKQEADAKFETQTNASTEYAKLQPKTLSVPISMLQGSTLVQKTTVESVLQTMDNAMTNVELTAKVFEKRVLTSADDLDDIKTTGLYFVQNSAPANSPEGSTWFSLLVAQVAIGNVQQQVVKGGILYQRNYAGASPTWSSWYKVTGSIVT